MDLLASLNMDELPEQQTRTMHLIKEHPDFKLNLGFDACCTCGKPFVSEVSTIRCVSCQRVKYCSEVCRNQDGQVLDVLESVDGVDDQEQETAMGHTSVICALLGTINDDEAVEENDLRKIDAIRLQAAKDRVLSEYESYPATLANVLAEGPCFQQVLSDCTSTSRVLTIHVVGASDDAELWFAAHNETERYAAYAEAFADIVESRRLASIEIVFVGPDCPSGEEFQQITTIRSNKRDAAAGELATRTIKGLYSRDLLEQHTCKKADIVVFFNPGFTVPDYSWADTLSSIEKGTPFLLTTNTELEGIADSQYLLDQDKIQCIPPGLADIFGLYSAGDDDEPLQDTAGGSFFSENPFCGSRVRQSGTMANDLFVKNRWMLGGILDSFDPSKAKKDESSKRVRTGEAANSKENNPALI